MNTHTNVVLEQVQITVEAPQKSNFSLPMGMFERGIDPQSQRVLLSYAEPLEIYND